jgi:hypothetical protein
MKKLSFILVLFTVLISSISISAFAQSGKATIPPGDYSYQSATSFSRMVYFVSNITSNP